MKTFTQEVEELIVSRLSAERTKHDINVAMTALYEDLSEICTDLCLKEDEWIDRVMKYQRDCAEDLAVDTARGK